jgi:hypothetical protein
VAGVTRRNGNEHRATDDPALKGRAAMAQVAIFPSNLGDEIGRPEGVSTRWVTFTPESATRVLDTFETFADKHPELRMTA